MRLGILQQMAWEIAEAQGHHESLRTLPEREATMIRLALVHSEVSEALQVVKRYGITPESRISLAEELADTMIRLIELAECLDIDLETAVLAKMAVNRERPYGYGTPGERGA